MPSNSSQRSNFRRELGALRLVPLLALVATTFLPLIAFGQASFTGLGSLPNGNLITDSRDISADGSVVVAEGRGPVRWTAAGGGTLLPRTFTSGSDHVFAISADGSVAVGRNGARAVQWDSTGISNVGPYPASNFNRAVGVSSDGSVIVGRAGNRWFHQSDAEGFRVMGSTSSDVVGVSDDGLIVAGNDRGPFTWTDATGQVNLGQHPDAHTSATFANRISPDGNVIVGWASTPNGRQGFRWTQGDGYENLGEAGGSGPSMWDALDTNFDGSIVVGSGLDASSGEIEAYIWDEANGARSLRVLLSAMGVDVTGWEIWGAQAVSHDGRTIVGVGQNPNGDREAWIAVIPEPSTSILIGGGLILLSCIRRTSVC